MASRAAVLASLLPADVNRDRFLHVLGIHGDPVAARTRISAANRTGERLGAGAYGYPRAFGYIPDDADRIWLHENTVSNAVVLDPTAGGGSVPFEAVRVGLHTVANDLNPVAALIERATIEWPARFGASLRSAVEELGERLTTEVRERLAGAFPEEPREHTRPDGYLWTRTVTCPYCDGLVPLSPNWRLAPGRHRGQADAASQRRSRIGGPGLYVRGGGFGGGAVARHGLARGGRLSLAGLRTDHRRGRDQGAGASRADGGAALRRRLQGAGRGQDEDGADPREVGTRLPGAAARGRQRRRDPGAARREVAGVGSLRPRSK